MDEVTLRVPLQEGWQGGPAFIEFEVDEIMLYSGEAAPGVIIKIETPCQPDEESTVVELGTGKLEFWLAATRLEFWLAADMEQVEAIHETLGKILAGR